MNCPICGKRMHEFKNPRRFQCLTSDAEHEKIIKASERSDRSRAQGKKTHGNPSRGDRGRFGKKKK